MSMSAIEARFATLRDAGRKALVCYITAGYPDRETSIACLRAIAEGGADVIEVGIPFSDPMADGPVIQASSQRALEQGTTLDGALEIIREANVDVPVVLFSYLNPILAAGPDLIQRAHAAGCSGLLITDLPLGSDVEREQALASGPLDLIRLVAPTTPPDRIRAIVNAGRGFVYLISRLGVTGERAALAADLPATIARVRSVTTLPVCVGFGVSTPEQAQQVSVLADGVVVGSAVVRAASEGAEQVQALVRSMRIAIDVPVGHAPVEV